MRTTKAILKQVCLQKFPDTQFLTDLQLCEALSRRYEKHNYTKSAADYIAGLRKQYAIGVGYKCIKDTCLGFRTGTEGWNYVSF